MPKRSGSARQLAGQPPEVYSAVSPRPALSPDDADSGRACAESRLRAGEEVPRADRQGDEIGPSLLTIPRGARSLEPRRPHHRHRGLVSSMTRPEFSTTLLLAPYTGAQAYRCVYSMDISAIRDRPVVLRSNEPGVVPRALACRPWRPCCRDQVSRPRARRLSAEVSWHTASSRWPSRFRSLTSEFEPRKSATVPRRVLDS